MSLKDYRNAPLEKTRTADLLKLIPHCGKNALDIGAREGHFSRLLALKFANVTALDLVQPDISAIGISCVAGDVTNLKFADSSFDLVFCAEVLEHIPCDLLGKACKELARVTRHVLVIGVPFEQDLRVGRTQCGACQKTNPPWGHVNVFNLESIKALFPSLSLEAHTFVGEHLEMTNAISSIFMRWAGDPYGTYMQDEPCIHCGCPIAPPKKRSLSQKVLTRLATLMNDVQRKFSTPKPIWIHLRFRKPLTSTSVAQ